MTINTRALDAALNVLGLTMGLPINTLVFNTVKALEAAEQTGRNEGYADRYEAGELDAEASQYAESDAAYMNGYAQGAADMQAEDAEEIEGLELEVQQVANEQYDDGYLDAAHDFSLSPAGAMERAGEIEEARLAKINRTPVECDCVECRPELYDDVDMRIFPVDAEDLV